MLLTVVLKQQSPVEVVFVLKEQHGSIARMDNQESQFTGTENYLISNA